MVDIQANPNSIYISTIPSKSLFFEGIQSVGFAFLAGCCKAEFDSTYPVHLNGIISPDEFGESIKKINDASTSDKKPCIILIILFVVSWISGMLIIIVGTITRTFTTYIFVFLIAAIVVTAVGTIPASIGFCIVQSRCAARVQQVIAEESKKYSSRSAVPCSWKLETTRLFVEGYRNNRVQLVHHLVIDIGRSTVYGNEFYSSNKVAHQSISLVGRQDNYASPSYPDQSTRF